MSTTPAPQHGLVSVSVDGQPVGVPPDRTVAGVLMLMKERQAWRVTRSAGEPRGVFCGIGVCFDCLVTINGERSMRACLVQVTEGMTIETESRDD